MISYYFKFILLCDFTRNLAFKKCGKRITLSDKNRQGMPCFNVFSTLEKYSDFIYVVYDDIT
jgi:hypothetical protein